MEARKYFLIGFGILLLGYPCKSNAQELSKDELEQRASTYFEKGEYEKAMADYGSLYNLFPKDVSISYFLGRSCLHANRNLEKAAELLRFAAVRNYGEDAYFYLGQAYLLLYRFADAETAFNAFNKTAKPKMLKQLNTEYWLMCVENARKSSLAALRIETISNELIPVNLKESAFAAIPECKYVFVPDEFRSTIDIDKNFQSLIAIDHDIAIGEYFYFESFSKKTGTDIYRAQRLTSNTYSLPEILPSEINSNYNEGYPFFECKTGKLFFSSKGHNTSGGFDIFSSHFDSLTNKWTLPEKLDFPINTPYDDIMYTTSKDLSKAVFLSLRSPGTSSYVAYTIVPNKNYSYTSFNSADQLMAAANMQVSDNLAYSSNDIQTIDNQQIDSKGQAKSEMTAIIAEPSKSDIIEVIPISLQKSEYESSLADALTLQTTADSLHWAVKNIQARIKVESDYLRKQELVANLTVLNKEANRVQKNADEKFLQAARLNPDKVVDYKKPVEKENATQSGSQASSSPEVSTLGLNPVKNDIEYKDGIYAGKLASEGLSKEFMVLNSSPYSVENPIPLQASLPNGLVYRIQLGAFSGRKPENSFGGLFPMTSESISEKNITKYYVGYFNSSEEARKALENVKEFGYNDAFLVSYFDLEKINIQKAREIEFSEKLTDR